MTKTHSTTYFVMMLAALSGVAAMPYSIGVAGAIPLSTNLQEVAFQSHGVSLSGAIAWPEASPVIAALVLVHGSGPQERMVPLAMEFAAHGIAVLTYDKRGVGRSAGQYEGADNASSANLSLLADDASAAMALLAG